MRDAIAHGNRLIMMYEGNILIDISVLGESSCGHTGTDIAAPAGTTIWASKGGTVAYAGWSNGYGYNVLINHGDGTKTRYAHCSSLAVYTGQQVSQGQVVGYVGQTGWASGNHCHFEIISNGTFLDARNYIGYSR